jgi:hypothetical protein
MASTPRGAQVLDVSFTADRWDPRSEELGLCSTDMDARESTDHAAMVRHLCEDGQFRNRISEKAAKSARLYIWEGNGRQVAMILEKALRRKSVFKAQFVTQEL